MPIYEYHCGSCGKTSEVIQKFSDSALTVCPACTQAGALEKLISRTSFQLKGSGWYASDYKKAPDTPKAACEPTKPEGGCAKPDCAQKTDKSIA